MSTFDGIVKEFPSIRIDYFRPRLASSSSSSSSSPPTACFLSHVHSDHIVGLDSHKMPFVYCTAVTRRILLKMEKYPHRINFSKGILESRKQTYKHLKTVLRPLPLQTPVELELGPKQKVRVTLFDANHCPGACMFLIEGDERTVLYTGDIRAEPWWVDSLIRSPILIPYVTGQRQLDCLYLDTTFASHDDIYKHFPTKAEGLSELLSKIDACPNGSVFYFRAWTLGYEDAWLALSSKLRSRVHVDRYQLNLFHDQSSSTPISSEMAALGGFQLGHSNQPGLLTTDSDGTIHSCEPGLPCHLALTKNKNTVWITPIITRTQDGTEVAEVGAGGGGGDLYRTHEVEIGDGLVLQRLRTLAQQLTGPRSDLETVLQPMQNSLHEPANPPISLDIHSPEQVGEITIDEFLTLLSEQQDLLTTRRRPCMPRQFFTNDQQRVIRFPYSRHSSYDELRELVSKFRPKDICPCVVDYATWSEQVSVETLFGDLCSTSIFAYDAINRGKAAASNPTEFETQTASEYQSHPSTQITEEAEDNGHSESNPEPFGGANQVICEGREDGIEAGQERTVATLNQPGTRISTLERIWLDTKPVSPSSSQSNPCRQLLEALDHSHNPDQCEDSGRFVKRKLAYLAAEACLRGDSSLWSDLQIQSVQFNKDEVEL